MAAGGRFCCVTHKNKIIRVTRPSTTKSRRTPFARRFAVHCAVSTAPYARVTLVQNTNKHDVCHRSLDRGGCWRAPRRQGFAPHLQVSRWEGGGCKKMTSRFHFFRFLYFITFNSLHVFPSERPPTQIFRSRRGRDTPFLLKRRSMRILQKEGWIPKRDLDLRVYRYRRRPTHPRPGVPDRDTFESCLWQKRGGHSGGRH